MKNASTKMNGMPAQVVFYASEYLLIQYKFELGEMKANHFVVYVLS